MLSARLLRRALTTRFVDHRPFILSHLLTARCNADCHTCLWKRPADAKTDELSTADIAALYRDAAATGFAALVLWGGEPLLRRDTGAVLRAARTAGLNTTLITNGWWLEDRADEVLPWVNRLMVSVDATGARHDEIRRLPGLFARLDRGLRAARSRYPGVVIIVNAVLSRLNIEQLEIIAAYGRARADHVAFQAMDTSDYGYALRPLDVARLRLTPAEEADAARRIAGLKRIGFPVSDSRSYLARLGPGAPRYRCHFKKVCLRVEPNGDVLDCTRQATALANVRHTPLRVLCDSPPFREFQRRAEACNRCRDAAVVEISHMWEGRVDTIWHAIRTLA
jgi:MoaA/NifB/PqqE/SkfB family radical SAM enzyme